MKQNLWLVVEQGPLGSLEIEGCLMSHIKLV